MTYLDFKDEPTNPNTPANQTTAIVTSLQTAEKKLVEWTERSGKAVAALSTIKAITTDEEDKAAEEMLVRVRDTYNLINKERLEFTGKIDELKKFLMIPEKAIATDAKADSEYNRVRNLRNAFAQDKLDKQRAEEARIAKEQAAKNELTRLKALIEQNVHDGIVNTVHAIDKSTGEFVQKITLADYDKKILQFNVTPKLKEELFNSWLTVQYNTNALTVDQFNEFMGKVREQLTYERINGEYVKAAMPIIQIYKDKLPQLKLDLEELERVRLEDAAKAQEIEEQRRKDAEKEQAEKDAKAEKEKAEHAAELEQKAKNEQLNTTFEAQVQAQAATADLKGTLTKRVATITAPHSETVIVFSNVLLALFNNPNFVGHIKIDKTTGEQLKDDTGRPIYQDWAEQLLDIYANTCDAPIPGIEIKEKVITTAKKSKQA